MPTLPWTPITAIDPSTDYLGTRIISGVGCRWIRESMALGTACVRVNLGVTP